MKQEEIQERNKQIALMLGGKILHDYYLAIDISNIKDYNLSFYFSSHLYKNKNVILLNQLLFHVDWNWLMKAVDFIEKQIIAVWIHGNNCLIQSVGKKENKFLPITYADVYSENKIQTVFIAVSDFAKLYNENKI